MCGAGADGGGALGPAGGGGEPHHRGAQAGAGRPLLPPRRWQQVPPVIHLLPGLLHPEGPAGAPAGDKVTHPGSTFQDVAFSKNWSVSVRILQAGRAGVLF